MDFVGGQWDWLAEVIQRGAWGWESKNSCICGYSYGLCDPAGGASAWHSSRVGTVFLGPGGGSRTWELTLL